MSLALIGVALGLGVAYALTQIFDSQLNLKSMLFGVQINDPMMYSLIAIFLTFVTLISCYIPARRATKVDPLVVLSDQ